MRFLPLLAVVAFLVLALAVPASAHPSAEHVAGAADGVVHPFSGLDHLLAMLAVGLLAAKSGGRLVWLLPVLFVTAMIAGGSVALATPVVAWSGLEQAIAASVVVFGLLLIAIGQLPVWIALAAVPAFGLFHGYAHLAEGVGSAGTGVIGFGLGMVASTVFLHLIGIAIGLAARKRMSLQLWRLAGATISAAGVMLLAQSL